MKSKYLDSAEDLEVGDVVLYDGNEMDPVTVEWLGDIFARVSGPNGEGAFSIMRNRLTKTDHDLNQKEQTATTAKGKST